MSDDINPLDPRRRVEWRDPATPTDAGVREAMTKLDLMPSRWWQVIDANGRVWCQTSDEDEARRALATCPTTGRLQRLYDRLEREWRDES